MSYFTLSQTYRVSSPAFPLLCSCTLLLNSGCKDIWQTLVMPPKQSLLQPPHRCSALLRLKWGTEDNQKLSTKPVSNLQGSERPGSLPGPGKVKHCGVLSSVTGSSPSSLILAGSLVSEGWQENEGDSHNPRAIPLTSDLHSAL